MAGSGFRAKIQQGGVGATFLDAAGIGFGVTGLNGTPVTLVGTIANNNMVNITQNGNNNQVLNLAGDPGSYGSQ